MGRVINFPGKDKGVKEQENKPAQEPLGYKAAKWLEAVAKMVREKSDSYGDSAGDPIRIFSKANSDQGLTVRIDDKLSRIARGKEYPGDDTIRDLVGYLALYAAGQEPGKEQVDPEPFAPSPVYRLCPICQGRLGRMCFTCAGLGYVYSV